MVVVNAKTPSEYLAHLTTRANRKAELRLLLNEITIGETYMFRSPPQLEALRNVILPELINSKNAMGFKRLRLWSAGCSTGEEPYTLAMFLLEESTKLLAGWTFVGWLVALIWALTEDSPPVRYDPRKRRAG